MRRFTQALAPPAPTGLHVEPGTVVAVIPGGAADGIADRVEVSWRGAQVPMPYPVGLELAVTDVVNVGTHPGSPPQILGRNVGAP